MNMKKICLTLCASLLILTSVSRAETPNPSTKPIVGFLTMSQLMELNREYARMLYEARVVEYGSAAETKIDENQLYGTVLFNERLYKKNELYHERGFCKTCALSAELVGFYTQNEYVDIKELVEMIYDMFKNSPKHHKLQMNTDYTYVSISYMNNYFAVRLGALPKEDAEVEMEKKQFMALINKKGSK
jgi:hypothetical protein